MKMDRVFQFEVEAARQFALERYDILDTAEEYRFDHITTVAKLALDVPMVAISLLDGNRQWFKSKIGFEALEVPRDSTFCNHAIDQNCSLIIEDATLDPQFKDNPSVTGIPFLRSYIGVPLTTPDGHNIGTLSALDIVPRQFGHSKVELMEQLAELVMHELELRQQTAKDRLTGTFTRSGFSVAVQKVISLYGRQKVKSTLVLFDVNLYKMVAHHSGRLSGNALLQRIAQYLTARLPPPNCVGRMGGTQFAVLLTATTQAEAKVVAEDLMKRMEFKNAELFLDVGFSEISPEIGICDDWLKQANADLNIAKESDRRGFRLKSGKRSVGPD
ncbi:diguanylate cyclase [uncultured Parasphingorhabdus sp.]|uniref:sensor domain-containing diguanylate cyclase n=1 Tax=uncultured Parasphingorhabdus sp. TaxID=2709694 RepID=UPI0030DD2A45|tara:strand:+ start:22842 stop:23831 length:990 start_codon:yes stop_codon:yes gene_type:complete